MKQVLSKFAFVATTSIALCGSALGTTIQVDSTSGDLDASSCTLVGAFKAAHFQQVYGTCPAGTGDDVIVLPADVTINVSHLDDGAGEGLPYVTSNLLLLGNGSTISSTLGGPLITVLSTGVLSVNDVTLQGIQALDVQNAAAISVLGGTLNVTNTVFSGNVAHNTGSALYSSFGSVDIEDSVFLGNSAAAIFSDGGSLRINSSYFAHNSGVAISSNNLYVVNSTFIENGVGIDVRAFGSGSVSYSTFEANANAVSLEGNSLLLADNLFAHPVGGYPAPNCGDYSFAGGMVTVGQNLSDDFSCPGATVVADRNAFAFGDPVEFRGLNAVLPLRKDSAAIGPTSCTDATGREVGDDQRGVSRHWHCSLGAFEFDDGDYAYTPPSAMQPLDILISDGTGVIELTRTGQIVRNFYPSPHIGVYGVRGIEPAGLSTFGMFLQQNDAHLQLYDVPFDTWTDFTQAGWYTLPSETDGKISHVGNRWFLSGYAGSDIGEDYIVAFDQNGFQGSAAACSTIHALQASRAGLLYVICDAEIDVFDPQSLSKTRTIDTSNVSSGNTVTAGVLDTSGNIFLTETDGRIYRIDDTAQVLASTDCFNDSARCGFGNSSMAISDDGELFIGSLQSASNIMMLDTGFTTVSTIPTGLDPRVEAFYIAALPGDEIFGGNFQ